MKLSLDIIKKVCDCMCCETLECYNKSLEIALILEKLDLEFDGKVLVEKK